MTTKKLSVNQLFWEQVGLNFIVVAILIAMGWLLVQKLGASGRMQDCLMSGRTNCNQIQPAQ